MANRITRFLPDWPDDRRSENTETPLGFEAFEPSTSAYSALTVAVDAMGRDLLPSYPAMVDVKLEQTWCRDRVSVALEFSSNADIADESGNDLPTRIVLRNPNALEAIIRCLLGLTIEPRAVQMLREIPPSRSRTEPGNANDKEGGDDDGDEWKQGAFK